MILQEASIACELVLFEDGRAIIDHIRQRTSASADSASPASVPDLIVLDLNLPKSDGLEILQVIRDAPPFAKVPIAVLSSSPPRERAKLEPFQIREFIVKPSDLEEYLKIANTIRVLLD